jgi:hypothetical protein
VLTDDFTVWLWLRCLHNSTTYATHRVAWFPSFLPSYGATGQIGPWPPLLRFLNHTIRHRRQNSSGQVISPSHRPLHTQDTTYKHKIQPSMTSAGFEPAIPATARSQTYATGTGVAWFNLPKMPCRLRMLHSGSG